MHLRKRNRHWVYLYLSKAFDIVNHTILIHKSRIYGIWDLPLKWSKGCWADRDINVQYDNHNSVRKKLEYGVVQGSVLRPLISLICVNDLPNYLNSSWYIIFADDTAVSIHTIIYRSFTRRLIQVLIPYIWVFYGK